MSTSDILNDPDVIAFIMDHHAAQKPEASTPVYQARAC